MLVNFTKLLAAALLLISITSCERKNCAHVTCPTGTECASGACICEDGYEGSSCQTLSSTKYTNYSWLVTNTCNDPNSSPSYNINMYPCNNTVGVNCITLNGFIDGQSITAYIENTSAGNLGNTLYIPSGQQIGSITTASSSGTYFASTTTSSTPVITINMNYSNGANAFSCVITMYQQ